MACRGRGLTCTSKDKLPPASQRKSKLSGQLEPFLNIIAPPQDPEIGKSSARDGSYLDFYLKYRNAIMIFGFPSNESKNELLFSSAPDLPSSQLQLLPSSKPLRYAVLALASAALSGLSLNEHKTIEYLRLCYKHTIEAITTKSLVEVFYTTYILVLLGCFCDEDFSDFYNHMFGMSVALKELTLAGTHIVDTGELF